MPRLQDLFEQYEIDSARDRTMLLLDLGKLSPKEKKSIFFSVHIAINREGNIIQHRPGWQFLFDTFSSFSTTTQASDEDLNQFAIAIIKALVTSEVLNWIRSGENEKQIQDLANLTHSIQSIIKREDIDSDIKTYFLCNTPLLKYIHDLGEDWLSTLFESQDSSFFTPAIQIKLIWLEYTQGRSFFPASFEQSDKTSLYQFALNNISTMTSEEIHVMNDLHSDLFFSAYIALNHTKKLEFYITLLNNNHFDLFISIYSQLSDPQKLECYQLILKNAEAIISSSFSRLLKQDKNLFTQTYESLLSDEKLTVDSSLSSEWINTQDIWNYLRVPAINMEHNSFEESFLANICHHHIPSIFSKMKGTEIQTGLNFLSKLNQYCMKNTRIKKTALAVMLSALPNILINFKENQWTSDLFLNLLQLFHAFSGDKHIDIMKFIFEHMQENLQQLQSNEKNITTTVNDKEKIKSLIEIIQVNLQNVLGFDCRNELLLKLSTISTSTANMLLLLGVLKERLSIMRPEQFNELHPKEIELLDLLLNEEAKLALSTLQAYISPKEKQNIIIRTQNTLRERVLDSFAQNSRLCYFLAYYLCKISASKEETNTQYNVFIMLYQKPSSHFRTLLINIAAKYDIPKNSTASYLIQTPKNNRERMRSGSFGFLFSNKTEDDQFVTKKRTASNASTMNIPTLNELPNPLDINDETLNELMLPINFSVPNTPSSSSGKWTSFSGSFTNNNPISSNSYGGPSGSPPKTTITTSSILHSDSSSGNTPTLSVCIPSSNNSSSDSLRALRKNTAPISSQIKIPPAQEGYSSNLRKDSNEHIIPFPMDEDLNHHTIDKKF